MQARRSDRHDDPDGRPRRGHLLVALVAFLLIVGGVVAAGGYYSHCKGASGPKNPVAYTVKPGTSGEEVVSQLHDLGVIRCSGLVGRIMLRSTRERRPDPRGELHTHHEHDARRRDRGLVDASAGGSHGAPHHP